MEAVGNEVTECGRGGVVVVMEVTKPPLGVRTRARSMALVTDETDDYSGDVKRRKLGNDKLRSRSSTFVQTKTLDCDQIHVHSVLKENLNDSCRSSGVPASSCSSTGSMEELKVSDLEESVEVESAEAKQSIEMNKLSCRAVLPAGKMPPEAELEEFFAAAQEGLNERFKNKYNYDIVNDSPLEGRFEWIQVKPGNDDGDD